MIVNLCKLFIYNLAYSFPLYSNCYSMITPVLLITEAIKKEKLFKLLNTSVLFIHKHCLYVPAMDADVNHAPLFDSF